MCHSALGEHRRGKVAGLLHRHPWSDRVRRATSCHRFAATHASCRTTSRPTGCSKQSSEHSVPLVVPEHAPGRRLGGPTGPKVDVVGTPDSSPPLDPRCGRRGRECAPSSPRRLRSCKRRARPCVSPEKTKKKGVALSVAYPFASTIGGSTRSTTASQSVLSRLGVYSAW